MSSYYTVRNDRDFGREMKNTLDFVLREMKRDTDEHLGEYIGGPLNRRIIQKVMFSGVMVCVDIRTGDDGNLYHAKTVEERLILAERRARESRDRYMERCSELEAALASACKKIDLLEERVADPEQFDRPRDERP